MFDFFGSEDKEFKKKQKKAEEAAKYLGKPAKTVMNRRKKQEEQLKMLQKEMRGYKKGGMVSSNPAYAKKLKIAQSCNKGKK